MNFDEVVCVGANESYKKKQHKVWSMIKIQYVRAENIYELVNTNTMINISNEKSL